MTIMDGSINGTYVVTDISMEGNIMRRLESLFIPSDSDRKRSCRERVCQYV